MNNRAFNIIFQSLIESVGSLGKPKKSSINKNYKSLSEEDEEAPEQSEEQPAEKPAEEPPASLAAKARLYKTGPEDFTIAKTARATAYYDPYGTSGEIYKSRSALLYLQAIFNALKASDPQGISKPIREVSDSSPTLPQASYIIIKDSLESKKSAYLKIQEIKQHYDYSLLNLIIDQFQVFKANPNHINNLSAAATLVKTNLRKNGQEQGLQVIKTYLEKLIGSSFEKELINLLEKVYSAIRKDEPLESPESDQEVEIISGPPPEQMEKAKDQSDVLAKVRSIVRHYQLSKGGGLRRERLGKRIMSIINRTIGLTTPREDLDSYEMQDETGSKKFKNPINNVYIKRILNSNSRDIMIERLKGYISDIEEELLKTKEGTQIVARINDYANQIEDEVYSSSLRILFNVNPDGTPIENEEV